MQSRPTLFCLPPAGVSPSLFRPWIRSHQHVMAVHPVALPGREGRFNQPMPDSMDRLADMMAQELEACVPERYALFGYSMGAVLGYEIVRRWLRWGLPAPEVFFVLGCNAPDRILEGRQPIHSMDGDAFRRALLDLGGIQQEILDNAEAMALFEPLLRNDFRICETYRPGAERPDLRCRAHVFVADRDQFIQREMSALWSNFIAGGVTLHELRGNHMLDRDVFDAIPDMLSKLWLEPGGMAMPRRAAR